jgi:acyl transferase domain-containing protein
MYAPELARILSGLPHDAQVKVLADNGMARRSIEKIEVHQTATTLEILIVPIGVRR